VALFGLDACAGSGRAMLFSGLGISEEISVSDDLLIYYADLFCTTSIARLSVLEEGSLLSCSS